MLLKGIMLGKVLQLLSLACKHKRTSQPFATASASTSKTASGWDSVRPSGKHYVVCLDCGKKFDYDWKEMRIVS